MIADCSYSSLFWFIPNPRETRLCLKEKKAIANEWSLERIFREWTQGKVCSTQRTLSVGCKFGRYQIFAVFERKQALGKDVHTINLIYSFQVLIIIELSFILLCQGVVLVGESRFVL